MSENQADRQFLARDFTLPLGGRTLVMGIVNVTPDSFSDGGETLELSEAVDRALQHCQDGADIIDIGGESTRPGSTPVGISEELDRVIPVIEALFNKVTVPISIDTYKAEVARQALRAGASIVNDISAGVFDDAMSTVVREFNAGAVLMHIKGTPRNMQQNPSYVDVVTEVGRFLKGAVLRFTDAGVPIESILVDPGIGFGKNVEHNLELIRRLVEFQNLAAGVLVGTSRKSFIGTLTGLSAERRLPGSLSSAIAGSYLGADIVRVHDVKETVEALKVADTIRITEPVVA